MPKDLIAKVSAVIDASPARVWEALTKPELVKQYFFRTELITDWKEGAPITYRGEWEGKHYEDKGTVLKFEPEKKIITTYWSPLSGKPDTPEHYNTITYELSPQDGGTLLAIAQDNCTDEEGRKHSEKNWGMILEGMKKMLQS